MPAVAALVPRDLREPDAPAAAGMAGGRGRPAHAPVRPTGSGKTLAAFLACLDHLWRVPEAVRGVRILYISPLKALNNDVYRNLQVPLDGIIAPRRPRERPCRR